MAEKYIKQDGGSLKEQEALVVSAGSGNAGEIPALNAQGKLDNSVLPTGIGADTGLIECSEDLSAGEFVNIYDDAGTPKCRLADATTAGKKAHGFVLASVTSGADATVYFEGTNDQVSGLTAGVMFLSSTAGSATSTVPSATGNIVQKVGIAISATTINVEFAQSIELA